VKKNEIQVRPQRPTKLYTILEITTEISSNKNPTILKSNNPIVNQLIHPIIAITKAIF
jgi:hypothetical protein